MPCWISGERTIFGIGWCSAAESRPIPPLSEAQRPGLERHYNRVLQDMHSNVLKWCLHVWHNNVNGAPTDVCHWLDPLSVPSDIYGARGGAWIAEPRMVRSAFHSKLRVQLRLTVVSGSGYVAWRNERMADWLQRLHELVHILVHAMGLSLDISTIAADLAQMVAEGIAIRVNLNLMGALVKDCRRLILVYSDYLNVLNILNKMFNSIWISRRLRLRWSVQ
jgi:hypothetical protein